MLIFKSFLKNLVLHPDLVNISFNKLFDCKIQNIEYFSDYITSIEIATESGILKNKEWAIYKKFRLDLHPQPSFNRLTQFILPREKLYYRKKGIL